MTTQLLLRKAEEIIQKSPPDAQRELLAKLPHLLNLDPSDVGFLKLAEESFNFRNNPDDIVYDTL